MVYAHDLIAPSTPIPLALIPSFHTHHSPLLFLVAVVQCLDMYGAPETHEPWMEHNMNIYQVGGSYSLYLDI